MVNMENTFENNTRAARDILIKNGYTCVLYSSDTVYHSNLRGVAPLVGFLDSGKDFGAFCAADKTVGLGAAHLYILLGVRSLWANVISAAARELLLKNGIRVYFENEVPFIINREGTGRCPIESALSGALSSEEAVWVIKDTLSSLSGAGTENG